jgi:ATP-dependent Lon protease
VPAEVRKQLNFVFAETVDDVLAAALEPDLQHRPADEKDAEQRA